MVCREPLVGGVPTFGMETVRAFGSAYWFGPQSKREGPWVAPLFTAGILFYLGVLTYMAGRRAPGKPSLLRSLVTTYMVFTGVVELTRFVWDVSRFALVWAALHNLAEWGIIGFTVFKAQAETAKWSSADAHWWRSQLWVLLVSQVILFAPTLAEGGAFEQIVGLTCDWLLLGTWFRLYRKSDTHKRKYVFWGLCGAVGHMLEILPLVGLLVGLVGVPSTPGCILISFSTPITFYCYHRMVQGFDESGDQDLVTSKATDSNGEATKGQNLAVSVPVFSGMVLIALLCSSVTLLGPVKVYAPCLPAAMQVPPGQVLPPGHATVGAVSELTSTSSGIPLDGQVPSTHGTSPAAPATGPGASATTPSATSSSVPLPGSSGIKASNELQCASRSKLTGTTTIFAKPGMGATMKNLAATMPGPIQQEDGNLFYEEAWGGDNESSVKFFESWSSIRSMYKHIYTSPTVKSVFRSENFAGLMAKPPLLEGPFKAMVPCSEVAKEAEPVDIPMSTVIDAPVDCLWDRINAWGTDCSWVQGSNFVTKGDSPFLRTLHFNTTNVLVLRQTTPLPEPEQPAKGHRLIYYMLTGAFMDTIGEMYRGDLTIVPSPTDPSKTLFTYTATTLARDPSQTATFAKLISDDFHKDTGRIQFLQKWGRDVAATAECKAAHPQVPPTPSPSTASAEYFYVFELSQDAPAMVDGTSTLEYLLSKQAAYTGPAPEVLYAANVGHRNFPASKVLGPDLKKAWSVALAVRFPVGCVVAPAAVGAGVAVDTYRVEVRQKQLPMASAAATCPDSPALAQAIAAEEAKVGPRFDLFKVWYADMHLNSTNPALPVRPNDPVSGINLLQFKPDVIGQPCYQRYLSEVYELISRYGGGLYYFAEVVDSSKSWNEIVIPRYNTGNVFFQVVFNPKYRHLLGLQKASLMDEANIDVTAISGSLMF